MHIAFLFDSFFPRGLVSTEIPSFLFFCFRFRFTGGLWLAHILATTVATNMLMASSLLYHMHTWE
jgi:hypothetical protein